MSDYMEVEMLNKLRGGGKVFFVFILAIFLGGCTIILQKGKRSDIEKIESLNRQLKGLEDTKRLLSERLKQEITDKEVRLEMAEKGLVITFLADILFASGKAKIKTSAYATLDKVARVLTENASDMNIGIEGHTDNVPIKHSRWKSNWELSSQRALSVLHYLVDKKGIEGRRISAIGYGEFRTVVSNDTKEGRQLNRRVEIVILPKIAKLKEGTVRPQEEVGPESFIEENLK